MSLSELLKHDPFELVKSIIFQLKEIFDQNDINPIVAKLKSMGYILYNIRTNGYGIIGDFRNKNFIKEIQIPYYKIDEDLLEQIDNMLEEYIVFRFEAFSSEIQEKAHRKLMKFDFDDVDWIEIYNTPEYGRILLDVAIELLFSRLNEYLKRFHRLDAP